MTLILSEHYFDKVNVHPTSLFIEKLKHRISKIQFTPKCLTNNGTMSRIFLTVNTFVCNDAVKKLLYPTFQSS